MSVEPPEPVDLAESFESFKAWLEDTVVSDKPLTPEEEDHKRWNRIGRDVYDRKFLVLVAAQALRANKVPRPLRHAATDVLVEKAQLELTDRASQMNKYGAWAYGAALAILVIGVVWLYIHAGEAPKKDTIDGYADVCVS